MKSNQLIFASACSLIVAWGCASQPKNNPDASYSEIKEAELSHERRDFISETDKQLKQVDHDLAQTQAKLDHESKYVTDEQRAEWSQDIFELKQERQRLSGELRRAETADDAEWKEMRGPIGVGVDSLQAGVTKVGNTIAQAFEPKQELGAQEGLCPLRVGKTDVQVQEQAQAVVVDVTVKDPGSVDELRTKAAELARNTTQYGATQSPSMTQGQAPASTKPAIPVALATQNIDDGVRVTFTPNATQLAALEERLSHDAKIVKEDRCTTVDNAQASAK